MGLGPGDFGAQEAVAPSDQKRESVPPDLLFGAMVGCLIGAVVGWVSCWLVDGGNSVWDAALVGALIGPVGGAIVGSWHRKRRVDLVNSEIGTTVCIAYALLPAILILLGGVGLVRGRTSGLFLLGMAFASPMAGLLVGGALDRAYESMLRRYSDDEAPR